MHEIATSWNYGIVALSVLTAIIGSYVALYFAARLRAATVRKERITYMSLGASTMGLAIWSMHFVGMLAMTMNMPMSYDPLLSFLSMVAAAVGAGIAFLILQRPLINRIHFIFGSIAMGLAISTMHYTGMASMRMAARTVYDPLLFAASIMIAIVASAGALWLAFRPIIGSTTSILMQKIGSAVVMGFAISGMHYTGMAAASYIHAGTVPGEAIRPTVGPFYLGDLLIAALVVFGVALIVLSAHAFAERQRLFQELRAHAFAERQRLFQELRASEARFAATFEQAAVGIGHVGANGELIRLNQRYCDILGYSQQELLGMTFQDVTYPDDLPSDMELFAKAKAREIPSYSTEKRYVRKNGSLVWVNLTVSIVWDDQGQLDYAIAVVEDITRKKQAEEALYRSQETLKEYTARLVQSNRDLEHFATIASHDLQAPLRKVIMFTESLKARDGARLSEEGHDYIERMQRATMRMQELINDLLTLSRVSRTGSPFEPTDLNRVVSESLEELEGLIRDTQGRVEVLNPLPEIDGDARQLQQVFQNLIGNALKFRKKDEAPIVLISSEIWGDICRIVVRDNGIGFSPEHAERIFGAFERLHGQGEYSGTGIGLSIVKKIIERHHGSITATGEPDKGAAFTITLPVKQQDTTENPADLAGVSLG